MSGPGAAAAATAAAATAAAAAAARTAAVGDSLACVLVFYIDRYYTKSFVCCCHFDYTYSAAVFIKDKTKMFEANNFKKEQTPKSSST